VHSACHLQGAGRMCSLTPRFYTRCRTDIMDSCHGVPSAKAPVPSHLTSEMFLLRAACPRTSCRSSRSTSQDERVASETLLHVSPAPSSRNPTLPSALRLCSVPSCPGSLLPAAALVPHACCTFLTSLILAMCSGARGARAGARRTAAAAKADAIAFAHGLLLGLGDGKRRRAGAAGGGNSRMKESFTLSMCASRICVWLA